MGHNQCAVCYVRMHGTAPAHFYFDPKVVEDKVGFDSAPEFYINYNLPIHNFSTLFLELNQIYTKKKNCSNSIEQLFVNTFQLFRKVVDIGVRCPISVV
jgi:hypothetical protein